MSTQDDCTGVTFAVGSVRGIRTFNVDGYGRLNAVSMRGVWKPGENVAKCNRHPRDEMYAAVLRAMGTSTCLGIAHPKCSCGFYAYHDGSRYHSGDVVGVVEGYGKTTVGTKGFRCEKARILALAVPGPRQAGRREWVTAALAAALFVVWLLLQVLIGGAFWIGFAASAPASILSGFLASGYLSLRKKRAKHNTTVAPLRDVIARNYPDVKLFDSLDEMKVAFPPDRGEQPSPETDPLFWDRP